MKIRKPLIRLQVISVFGSLLFLLYQQASDWPVSLRIDILITVLGPVILTLFYICAIAMYFRRWYAFVLAPVLTIIYILIFSEAGFFLSSWFGYQAQDDPSQGLTLLISSIGGLSGIIVGSSIGAALGQYIEFCQPDRNSLNNSNV